MIKIIIIPKLEEVCAENRAISYRIRFWTLFKNAISYIWYQLKNLYRYDLKTKNLRKAPDVKTIEGKHRAHKVSIKLAVELWRIIKGQKVNSHEETLLTELIKSVLNWQSNCGGSLKDKKL